MRFNEFKTQILDEGGPSGGKRFNSEVGVLLGLLGLDPATTGFDPVNPENTIPAGKLSNPDKVYSDIKKLLPGVFSLEVLKGWYDYTVADIIPAINKKGVELPDQYIWAGGKNKGGPADIGFVGSNISGISIKDEGGITLANPSPTALGFAIKRGQDLFKIHAPAEWTAMKEKIFTMVLDIAENNAKTETQAGKQPVPMNWNRDKYSILFDVNTNMFTITGKKNITTTRTAIIGAAGGNASWQRVFGDYFVKHFDKKLAYPLFKAVTQQFIDIMKPHLEGIDQSNANLLKLLQFGDKPMFYVTPAELYYIPPTTDINMRTIQLISISPAVAITDDPESGPDAVSLKFSAKIGKPTSTDHATVDIYVRYANGMFETNPTARIQNLQNPVFMNWEKLY
jgi:hypothetical protein